MALKCDCIYEYIGARVQRGVMDDGFWQQRGPIVVGVVLTTKENDLVRRSCADMKPVDGDIFEERLK